MVGCRALKGLSHIYGPKHLNRKEETWDMLWQFLGEGGKDFSPHNLNGVYDMPEIHPIVRE